MEHKIKFYGRRKGKKLRQGKVDLLADMLPEVLLDVSKPIAAGRETWLEIGFGSGEHLAEMAANNRGIDMIGAEVYLNGVANLLSNLQGFDPIPSNVRVYNDDIRLIMPLFQNEMFSRIFILFPDPWPKKRHASRRFFASQNLPDLYRILKPGGILTLATDIDDYVEFALENVTSHGGFKCAYHSRTPMPDWINTRYEQKALAAGRAPSYLEFVK